MVQGIGTIEGFCARLQPRATCAGIALLRVAKGFSHSTNATLAFRFSDVKRGTTLLVEDKPLLRHAAASILARLGFVVLQARDEVEAVDVFRQHRDAIRLVLCDLTMPHMNGWETLAALRRASPGIRVILTGGYDEADVMADEHDEQPNAFLAKPYPIDALRQAMCRALGATPAATVAPQTSLPHCDPGLLAEVCRDRAAPPPSVFRTRLFSNAQTALGCAL